MGKALVLACVLGGCAQDANPPPTARQFFARDVYPVLVQSCAGNTSGCHSNASSLPLVLHDSDGAYTEIVAGYAGAFASTTVLLPMPHAGGLYSPTVQDQITQWFALERDERGL